MRFAYHNKVIIALCLFFLTIQITNAQIVEIKGRVIDKLSKKPLHGVSVQVTKYKGTISNNKGEFSLKITDVSTKNLILTFSYVGYKRLEMACKPNIVNTFALELSGSSLKEVVVSTRAKSLVKRAIEKIPINYPTIPTIINGIKRVYNIVNDSDYYYKSDAILQVYSPTYMGTGEEQKVKLVQNKFVLLENKKSKFYNDISKPIWVGQYYAIPDPVFDHSPFINLDYLKNYTYTEREKEMYEGRKVYVIDFVSTTKKNTDGTIYIDTATLAFVGFDITAYNIKNIFFTPISLKKIQVSYQLINGKWYIKNTHSDTKHAVEYDSQYSTDFVFTSLDTIDVKPFTYSEVLQKRDENIKTIKPGDTSNWQQYDTIFKSQVLANTIQDIDQPNIDTTIDATAKKPKNNLLISIFKYLRNDNLRGSYAISKTAINTNATKFGSGAEYGLAANIYFRLYRGLFFQRSSFTNFGMGGVSVNTNGYSISYELIANKTHRPITIMPFAGYESMVIEDKSVDQKQRFKNWVGGINTTFEIKRRKSFFISQFYNHNFTQTSANIGIQPTNYAISIGLLFKF